MKIKKLFSKCIMIFAIVTLIISLFSKSVFAGQITSPGYGVGSGGGSGSGKNDTWIGPDYSSGIRWSTVYTGNVNWNTNISFEGITHIEHPARKWVCVQKNTKNGWKNFRWEWWYKYLRDPSKYGPSGLGYYPYPDGAWCERHAMPDPEIQGEIEKNGYKWNSSRGLWTNGSQHVDIAFVEGWQESKTYTSKSIYYAYTLDKNGNKKVLVDRTSSSAENIYNSPITSAAYDGKSLETEMHHEKTVYVKYIYVTKKETYMTDGSSKWNISASYSKGSTYDESKTITYDVKAPQVTQTWFRPFDLNKNGTADYSDVKASYPDYQAPKANLDMSVDNKQGITNKKKIQTLDTNTSTPFSVRFNNDQFGLPTSYVTLSDSAPASDLSHGNGAYGIYVMNRYGVVGNPKTGEFSYTGGSKSDVSGKITKDLFWQGSAHLDLSATSASLTYRETEKIGGNSWVFNKGWRGGDFIFKTTKMGAYKLLSYGRPWWEMNYEQGKFYTYGVSYNGTITLSGIGNPSINGKDFYAKLSSKQMTQPIIRGEFEAKTVGGDSG